MADAKDPLQFFERGVGVFFDLGVELFRVEFAPVSPAGFWGECSLLSGGQITIDSAATQAEAAGGLGLGTPVLDKFDHPFPQFKCISFHA
jgi:hypothetical protein